jgi:chemotaxis methyl-accepting protein methylase
VLWARPGPVICVWSACCSTGEEPYSLAALFHRHASELGELDRLSRVSIIGTDIDRECLRVAARGTFQEAAFADTPAELREAYFTGPDNTVIPQVRSLVRFEQRDLLGDSPFGGKCHLAVCRNVVIYFDRETQERVFANFHSALDPQGFLILGKVETLLGPTRTLFVPVDSRNRIFRVA